MSGKAYVIKIKDRFFHGFDGSGRLDSRPCFAGATLHSRSGIRDRSIDEIVDTLRSKGYSPKVFEVTIGEEVAPF